MASRYFSWWIPIRIPSVSHHEKCKSRRRFRSVHPSLAKSLQIDVAPQLVRQEPAQRAPVRRRFNSAAIRLYDAIICYISIFGIWVYLRMADLEASYFTDKSIWMCLKSLGIAGIAGLMVNISGRYLWSMGVIDQLITMWGVYIYGFCLKI